MVLLRAGMGRAQLRYKQVTLLWCLMSSLDLCSQCDCAKYINNASHPAHLVNTLPLFCKCGDPLFWHRHHTLIMSHIWNQTIRILVSLSSFPQCVFEIHSCCCAYPQFIILIGREVFHCIHVPQMAYPFMDIWLVFHLGLIWIKLLWFTTKLHLIVHGRKPSWNKRY